MKRRKSLVFSFMAAAAVLIAITAGQGAAAQTGVVLKPILKAGQERRFSGSALVDTQITPQGANGLTGRVRQELTATLLIRAGVPAPAALASGAATPSGMTIVDSGGASGDLVYYEVTIENAAAKAVVDGVEKPVLSQNLAGQKIELAIDAARTIVKCAPPVGAA